MSTGGPDPAAVRTFENRRADTVERASAYRPIVNGLPKATGDGNVDTLNEWYAELFLTPSSDPWLGLAPPDVYTALENDGQIGAIANRSRE
jgi:hypothetical protein